MPRVTSVLALAGISRLILGEDLHIDIDVIERSFMLRRHLIHNEGSTCKLILLYWAILSVIALTLHICYLFVL